MAEMQQLSHKTIEDLLLFIENAGPKRNTFGDVFKSLVRQINFVLGKSGSPDSAYFSYKPNKDYSVYFESSEGAINAMEGAVKSCEVVFFKKYQINPRASPLLATSNLERLFTDAFAYKSSLKSVTEALEKLGFVYGANDSLVGEFLIGRCSADVSVSLREIDKSLQISMKVRPIYKS